MTTWITVCDTCKRENWSERGMERTDGEAFAIRIEAAARGRNMKVRRHSCLMACRNACNVAIQADGKFAYVLGGFDNSEENAAAIVDYARIYEESETGLVPRDQRPQAVKGHFVSRYPPLPEGQ
ncbi:MAG: DUF1636 domain-containing protein [Pseudomonadota bacterium]